MAAFAQEWLDWTRNQVHSYLIRDGLQVRLTLPSKDFFKFPPSDLPATLIPPQETANFSPSFQIPTEWYNAALAPQVPITFALVYATVITYLNTVNGKRKQKPWAISQTSLFKLFVLTHNVILSAYSLWTFVGMLHAMRVSIVDPREYGLAATVDSFCKLHGPRGHGSAATYNESTSLWSFTDSSYRLSKDGLIPDTTDVGRIWNEGLAFYGWIFYLSKFYEVVDTLIIIAKGKKSSFLQTYHHAGAMLCMWAGIRYMSPPIWMFCLFNSFIHFIMYTFYFVTALGIRVPKPLKQTLTTMQIAQFVVGASYAFLHCFVEYQIPISIPYIYHLGEAVRSAIPSIKSDASSALATATATASADVGSWLKKLALRAAGREGLAENVENQLGQTFGVDAVHAVEDLVKRTETRYRNDLQWVHCLDTSGQTFAIYLNIFYLLPLTWLFAQFFVRSYLQRIEVRRRSSINEKAYVAGKSINDARKGVGRRLSEAFEDYQGANGDPDSPVVVDGDKIRKELREYMKDIQEEGENISVTIDDFIKEKQSRISKSGVTEKVQGALQDLKAGAQAGTEKVQNMYEELKADAQAGVQKAKEATEDTARSEETEEDSSETWNVVQSAEKSVEQLTSEETTSNAADTAEKVEEKANELSEAAVEKVKELGNEAKSKSEDVEEGVKESVEKAEDGAGHTKPKEKDHEPNGTDDRSTANHAEDPPASTEPSTESVQVQEGTTFADMAAKGVPEDQKGESIDVGGQEDSTAVKREEETVENGSEAVVKKENDDEGA